MKTKLKLLIVEDEPAIRNRVTDVFVYHGYEVEFARGPCRFGGGTERGYDLILLDVMLPGMDGLNLPGESGREQEQPIILLTAKTPMKKSFQA